MSAQSLFGTEDELAVLDAELITSETVEDGLPPVVTLTITFVTFTPVLYSFAFEC